MSRERASIINWKNWIFVLHLSKSTRQCLSCILFFFIFLFTFLILTLKPSLVVRDAVQSYQFFDVFYLWRRVINWIRFYHWANFFFISFHLYLYIYIYIFFFFVDFSVFLFPLSLNPWSTIHVPLRFFFYFIFAHHHRCTFVVSSFKFYMRRRRKSPHAVPNFKYILCSVCLKSKFLSFFYFLLSLSLSLFVWTS
jgi:hypothetical protein